MKNGKPYKYNAKDRLQKTPFKSKKKKKEEVTQNTIQIDNTRLNDSESLDTSFLEGRVEKKVANNTKEKEKILKDRSATIAKIRFFRNLFLTLSVICILLLIGLYSYDYVKDMVQRYHYDTKNKVVEKKEKTLIDSNYVFVGDYFTGDIPTEELNMDYHYVKVGTNDYKSSTLLERMRQDIYQYNPSIVFLEVGLFDIDSGVSKEDYISNLERIVKNIKNNRPYTKIYIESIYPINPNSEGFSSKSFGENVSNEKIIEYNKAIQELVKKTNINYLDAYSILVNNQVLDLDYTDNGYTLNSKGYQQINKIIQKVVG